MEPRNVWRKELQSVWLHVKGYIKYVVIATIFILSVGAFFLLRTFLDGSSSNLIAQMPSVLDAPPLASFPPPNSPLLPSSQSISSPAPVPYLSPYAPLDIITFCGPASDRCSGHGRCFFLRCFCDAGYFGKRCDIDQLAALSASPVGKLALTPSYGVATQTTASYVAIHQILRSREWFIPNEFKLRREGELHTEAFGWYASVPLQLGEVLEVGGGPLPHIGRILSLQWREYDSITLLDPLVHSYAKLAWSSFSNGRMRDAQHQLAKVNMIETDFETWDPNASLDPSATATSTSSSQSSTARSFDDPNAIVEEETVMFDTIIWNPVLPYSHDAFHCLQKLYKLLRPEGVLIMHERVFDLLHLSEKEEMKKPMEHMRDQEKINRIKQVKANYPLRMNREFLDHFLQFFHTIYRNNEYVTHRFAHATDPHYYSMRDKYASLQGQFQYFVGLKKLPQQTFFPDGTLVVAPPSPPQWIDHFYLIWSTTQLAKWRFHVLDSVFANHPNATVHIYGNALRVDVFQKFIEKGCKLLMHRWNDTEFFYNTPLAAWSKLNFNHYNYRVHVSDAFRLAVVWKYGGVYMDFDLFILNSLKGLRNMIAREAYGGMVNGALLIADQYHPFLAMAMLRFHTVHNITIWHSSGPLLQSKMVYHYSLIHPGLIREKNIPEPLDPYEFVYFPPDAAELTKVSLRTGATRTESLGNNMLHSVMNVYSPTQFYPHPWQDARNSKFWVPASLKVVELKATLERTYMFHVWTAMIGNMISGEKNFLHPYSFMGQLILSNCFALCEQFMEDNKKLITDQFGNVLPPPVLL